MADILTSEEDEMLMRNILSSGFMVKSSSSKWPKYIPMRLALNVSLNLAVNPSDEFDDFIASGEIALDQLTGKGKADDENFDDAICALLSAYHDEDLFVDEKRYRLLLQRHIRRGLYEIRTSWQPSHDFVSWLNEALLSHVSTGGENELNIHANSTNEEDLLNALKEVGIRAEVNEVIRGARIDRYLLKLTEINGFDIFKKSIEKIEFLLGLGEQGVLINKTNQPKVIGLDIPRAKNQWNNIGSSIISDNYAKVNGQILPVYLGENVTGEVFNFDLVEAPHLLIAGTTGSGKSICLHTLILSLILNKPSTELKIALIDPKHVELSQYKNIPHLYGDGVAYQVSEAMLLLEQLVEEMESRNERFNAMGVSNIEEANQRGEIIIPRIVVVIEELADLISQSKEIENPLVRLAQKSRSAGIHLVIATQRPDSATFSGLLRSNIPSRIALRVQKGSESRIILDENGAEKLLGNGDMLVKISSQIATRVHGAYVAKEDIKNVLQRLK